jgi:hypothetical protein|nr:MAG TPA: hypothetical protein [Caudoviricetes sp.]
MQLSDIEGLLRSHLIEGEAMVEEPTNHRVVGDRMYIITTAGLYVWAYVIETSGVYALETEGALEVWRPGLDDADRTIEAVLGHARRNGAPEPPPDPEMVFADAIAYLRPLLREGESISTGMGERGGDPVLLISTPANSAAISWEYGSLVYVSQYERGYPWYTNNKDDNEKLLRSALDEARTAFDRESYGGGNH